jgi:phosphatidylglycerophosphate synthase
VLLLVAPPLMGIRLYFNMLDGMVALESGKASRRGEIVNELPDRVSDVIIFAAVAHSGLANMAIAYWAALMAVMTAYVGTLAQAVTGTRRFEGVMSKQWRMVALGAGCFVMYGMMGSGGRVGRLSVLDWTNLAIIAGCVQTCYVRLRYTMADLATTDH